METKSICRCCLIEGPNKEFDYPYTNQDGKEVYSEIMLECFEIVLSHNKDFKSCICDSCIDQLRRSLLFKKQVLKCEHELLKITQNCKEEAQVDVKVEPFDENFTYDSDDLFLADSVTSRTILAEEIKTEIGPPTFAQKAPKRTIRIASVRTMPKASVKRVKPAAAGSRADQIRSLVSRLASSMGSDRIQKKGKSISIAQTKIKVADKLTLSRNLREDREVKYVFNKNDDNDKHASNVQIILKFSNAVPFKNHSVLGYICAYCNNAFPDPSDLRAHTESEHKKNRLNIVIKRKSPVVNLDVTDLTCALCDEIMENLFTFKEHIVKIHKETIHNNIKDQIIQFKLNKGNTHECALCTSKYETFKMLKQHMNKHYSNYVCDKCDTGFVTKRSLDTHLTTHIEGNFKCDYCEKVFANKTKKSYHEKHKHLGAKNIKNCVYCETPFTNYYRRNQHMIEVHNLEAKYKCNVCDKPYLLKSLLMIHIKKNHLMEKNCQCNECGHRFFGKKALQRHMVKHTGEKNYNCTVCNKSYGRKYTLTEHMKIHNNDRRFKCSVCELSFVQKCSLKSHLLSNHGISMAASDIVRSTSSQPVSSIDDGE